MNFTLEDSTTEKVSPVLENVVQNFLKQNKSCDSIQINLMFIIIIVLMVENGFSPLDEDYKIIDVTNVDITENIKKWHLTTGNFEVLFVICGFDVSLKLIVSPLGATVLVNLVIRELDMETYSVCVPVSRYVVSPQASTIPMIFRDLRHISIAIKNKILSAVKSRVLSYHGYASASLIGLPEEVLYSIFMYLPIVDINNVSKTCKRLNYTINKDILWHSLYKRDFGIVQSDDSSWFNLYKKKYVEEEDEKLRVACRNAGTMHDHMAYSDYVSYIDNPMWGMML